MHGLQLRSEGRRIRLAIRFISVLIVLGGASGAIYLAHAARRSGGGATVHRSTRGRPRHPAVFDVVKSSPNPGQQAVAYSPLLRIDFSQPIAQHWPDPTLTPSISGSWVQTGRETLEFRSKANFVPYSKVRLSVADGPKGIRDRAGVPLAAAYSASFTIAGASVLRLQQLLGELGYLPLTFAPGTNTASGPSPTVAPGIATPASVVTSQSVPPSPASPLSSSPATMALALDSEATNSDAVALLPDQGSFSWRYPNLPQSLVASWQPGVNTVLVRGAVMAFESVHGLPADGDAGPMVWRALLRAVARRQVSTSAYDYIEVTTTSPETLYVWQDGKVLYQSPANTGIAEAPTAPGTFPVYIRYASTTMSGTNPNGTHYDDPGVPYVAYFNGGDAVHGFLRGQYGYPQSLGCVELPYSNAATVFNYDPIGTLVNVS